MSIKVIEDGPEIVLTKSQHDRFIREYIESQKYTTTPVSFETWLRRNQAKQEPSHDPAPSE